MRDPESVTTAPRQAKPLAGRRVIVTRARVQSASLIQLFEHSGAEVLHFPVIEIVPPESWKSLDHVIDSEYDWLVFTSVNGVQSFFSRLHMRAKDFTSLRHSRVAAVGRVTADELHLYGVTPDVVPERFILSALLPLLPEDQTGLRTAVVRAEEGRDELIDELRRRGGHVDLGIAYRTVAAHYDVEAVRSLIASAAIDAVTFTSPSTVEHFFAPLHDGDREALLAHAAMVSIGRSTSDALRVVTDRQTFEARTSTVQGLHDAVVQALTQPTP